MPFQKGHTINLGRPRTEETKRKVSEARMGIKFSPETIAKMRIASKKRMQSPQARKRLSEIMKGKNTGENNPAKRLEVRVKISKASRARSAEISAFMRERAKQGLGPPSNKGVPMTETQKKKISQAHKKRWDKIGRKKRKRYKHSVDSKYIAWRKAVYERDRYACQICGHRGKNLQPHHIKSWAKYPELRYEISNGQTLCIPCHKKTDNYGSKKAS